MVPPPAERERKMPSRRRLSRGKDLDRLRFVARPSTSRFVAAAVMRARMRSPTPMERLRVRHCARWVEHEHGRRIAVGRISRRRDGDQIAIVIATGDFEHGDGRQAAGLVQLLPRAGEQALVRSFRRAGVSGRRGRRP